MLFLFRVQRTLSVVKEGGKEGREGACGWKEGKKEGRKEGRREGRKGKERACGRKEGRPQGREQARTGAVRMGESHGRGGWMKEEAKGIRVGQGGRKEETKKDTKKDRSIKVGTQRNDPLCHI
jgi:hypothetical protein